MKTNDLLEAPSFRVGSPQFTMLKGCASHTSPPAPAKKEYELTEDIAFIRSKTMNCKGCESNTCAEVCQQWQKEHDARVAKAAREQVLDELYKWICEDRESLHRMQIIHALILHSLVIEKIESLRAPQGGVSE